MPWPLHMIAVKCANSALKCIYRRRKFSVQSSVKVKPFKQTDPVSLHRSPLSPKEGAALSGAYKWLLRATVLIGGASVMVVEILGSRILAPNFGTTLHVWSALITVTLAALAVGYAVGGRVADRYPGFGSLMIVMGCSAATLLISDLI